MGRKIFGFVALALCLALRCGLAAASGETAAASGAPVLRSGKAAAASGAPARTGVTAASLAEDVGFLASESCGGRVCGTPGGALAAEYTAWRFGRIGLRPFGGSYMHRFDAGQPSGASAGPASSGSSPAASGGLSSVSGGCAATNVIGMVPAFGAASASRYIIVAAHFDNLAPVDEKFYPGADSNASGVAAMLGVAKHIADASAGGKILPYNIIFVALDGRQPDMAGAAELWRMLVTEELTDPLSGRGVKAANIVLFINLDTIGSTLAPLSSGRPDYLLMLGGSAPQKALLREKNLLGDAPLELGFDYYGNPGLTEMFYRRVSEQKIFLDHGVPAVMFTSGITDYTNRPEDTPDRLDYDILLRRTQLISRWLESVR